MKKSQITQQMILDKATQVFSQSGFKGISTKALSEEIQVSEALIFKYFKSKKGLLKAIVAQIAQRFQEESFKALGDILDTDLDFNPKFKRFIVNRLNFFKDNLGGLRLIVQELQFDMALRNKIKDMIDLKINPTLETLIDQGIETGVLKKNIQKTLVLSAVKALIYDMIFSLVILDVPYDTDSIQGKLDLIVKGANAC